MEADIIFCILEQLSFFDIVRYALVNKQINNISKNELLWKKMSEKDYQDKIDDDYKKNYGSHYRLCTFLHHYGRLNSIKSITYLDMSCEFIKSIPPEISLLTNLSDFNVYDNELRSVPSEICLLTGLEKLFLHNNRLNTLPIELSRLTNLVRLDLDYNDLESIPSELSSLTKLHTLYIDESQIQLIPECVKRLSQLTVLMG